MRTKSHFPCYKSYLFQVPGLLDEIEGNLLCPKISSPNVVESPLVKVQWSVALESSIWRNLELSKKTLCCQSSCCSSVRCVDQILSMGPITITTTKVKFLLMSHILLCIYSVGIKPKLLGEAEVCFGSWSNMRGNSL